MMSSDDRLDDDGLPPFWRELDQRAYSDRLVVIGLADELHAAARIARNGADEIDEARRRVLRVVDAAEDAGFTVGEDFSVRDPNLYDLVTAAARQTQAETFATDLRAAVGTLVATDAEVATQLTAATAGLGTEVFPDSGAAGDSGESGSPSDSVAAEDKSLVQLVDYETRPPTPLPGPPDDPANDVARHPDYPDHRPNGKWAPRNSGTDGDAAAAYTFDQMGRRGIRLVRQEIQVTVTDPATGDTLTRYYDALEPTGVPGQYVGIEHKVNRSPITPNQQTFDAVVKAGNPAQGKLNGEPIKVVDVDVIRVPWPPPTEATAAAPGASLPAPTGGSPFPDWGTFIPPEEAAQSGGEIGNLGKVLAPYVPRNPTDPRGTA